MQKPKYVILTLLLLTLFSLPASVLAQSPTPRNVRSGPSISPSNRDEAKENVCERIRARINNRLQQYQEKKERYHSRYTAIIGKVTTIADKLEAHNCDASQIRSGLQTLQTKLTSLADAYRLFVDYLVSARSLSCDSANLPEFRDKVSQAKAQAQIMRQLAKDLHNYLVQSLKPEVQTAVRACRSALKPTGLE